MGQYINEAAMVQDPKKGLNYLGRNVGTANVQSSTTGPAKTTVGDLTQAGAKDFAKNLFGTGEGYADTMAKWGGLMNSAKGFCG